MAEAPPARVPPPIPSGGPPRSAPPMIPKVPPPANRPPQIPKSRPLSMSVMQTIPSVTRLPAPPFDPPSLPDSVSRNAFGPVKLPPARRFPHPEKRVPAPKVAPPSIPGGGRVDTVTTSTSGSVLAPSRMPPPRPGGAKPSIRPRPQTMVIPMSQIRQGDPDRKMMRTPSALDLAAPFVPLAGAPGSETGEAKEGQKSPKDHRRGSAGADSLSPLLAKAPPLLAARLAATPVQKPPPEKPLAAEWFPRTAPYGEALPTDPRIPSLGKDMYIFVSQVSRFEERSHPHVEGFGSGFEESLVGMLTKFPSPPKPMRWKQYQAEAETTVKLRRGTVASQQEGGVAAPLSAISLSASSAPSEDSAEMSALWKACTGEKYDHPALLKMLHALTISEAKLFQDRTHEAISGWLAKKKSLPSLKITEPVDVEISKRHIDFGLGVDRLCPLNELIEDEFSVTYKGRRNARFKFLPLEQPPMSVKLKFTPQSGTMKKKQMLEFKVSLTVTSTINSRLLAVLWIESVKHFFTIRFLSEHSLFGVECTELVMVEDCGFKVPEILVRMKNYIYENGGLYLEGIFRVVGDSEETKRVKVELNQGKFETCKDIHVMSTLIKVWYREYPSLMLQGLDEKVFDFCSNEGECVKAFNTLPETNKNLMLWLLDLLADVAAFSKENQMSPKSLAIVLAPNLYSPVMADPLKSLGLSQKVATFVFNMLSFRLRERYQ